MSASNARRQRARAAEEAKHQARQAQRLLRRPKLNGRAHPARPADPDPSQVRFQYVAPDNRMTLDWEGESLRLLDPEGAVIDECPKKDLPELAHVAAWIGLHEGWVAILTEAGHRRVFGKPKPKAAPPSAPPSPS